MENGTWEFLIVGSGAGGATLARELTKRGKEVLVVERGRREEKIGTLMDSLRFFDFTRIKTPKRSQEGVILWRTLMAGGSTMVSAGNGTPCLGDELADLGISLEEEFGEVAQDMEVAPIAEGLLSEGSEKIRWAASQVDCKMELMPKFIDPVRCRKCGKCVFGCAEGAKWTALDYLDEAEESGAEVLYNTSVEEVLIQNGNVEGVRAVGPGGPSEIRADVVILAAGGLGTPVILQESGFEEAGSDLWVHLFVNTYGITEGLNQLQEPTMALVADQYHETEGFILSPFVQPHSMVRFMESGPRQMLRSATRLTGIMTKTADEPAGRVFPDGTVSKPVTAADQARLNAGSSIARDILINAGAHPQSIVVSKPQGAHPGGTSAIGKVVDEDLQTAVSGLFICDGSVLPTAAGMPPIMTICALAKRLAQTLAP